MITLCVCVWFQPRTLARSFVSKAGRQVAAAAIGFTVIEGVATMLRVRSRPRPTDLLRGSWIGSRKRVGCAFLVDTTCGTFGAPIDLRERTQHTPDTRTHRHTDTTDTTQRRNAQAIEFVFAVARWFNF